MTGRPGNWVAGSTIVGTALAILSLATEAAAQGCVGGTGTSVESIGVCNAVVAGTEILQSRIGMALAGGNPVPGANSTLGMRIGSTPRISIAARVTGVRADLPPMALNEGGSGLVKSINVDVAVGLFSGFRLHPTVGGFGSLDVVASLGKAYLPDEAAAKSNPASWAVGARVGLVRESFTAPGVSITALYRHIGDFEGGSGPAPGGGSRALYSMRDNSMTSLRAVVGKRLFVVGANIGAGYDRYSSAASAEGASCVGTGCSGLPPATASNADLEHSRTTVFVNITWTLLILNLVAEAGWQEGGDEFTAPLPSGQSSKTDKSTGYGSLAIRLSL